MNTDNLTLHLLNSYSGAQRRPIRECRVAAGSLGMTQKTNHSLRTFRWTFAVVLALSSGLVHAQTPTCAALPPPPGCNSVTSDNASNTAMGSGSLANIATGSGVFNSASFNTAAGAFALSHDTIGNSNTALGAAALAQNTTGGANTASGLGALEQNTNGFDNTASGFQSLTQNTTGNENTASGSSALEDNTIGNNNTASGYFALQQNRTGNYNTASGSNALNFNTTGNNNTASGVEALFSNTSASGNTASGYRALKANTTGAGNAAFGSSALQHNVDGSDNSASGSTSLYSNTSGSNNAASGFQALFANTTASDNTASGYRALYSTTTGDDNTATGFRAMSSNTTGQHNTAMGSDALHSNTTGLNNIGIGASAGYAVTGSNNIDIGSMGSGGESGVIRIGGASQTAAYIAGITATHLTGSPVYVSASGQLGVLASSERYKTAVASMGDSTRKLQLLRPVSFRLKSDPKHIVQYGLIAEEVDHVFPELVIRDDAGVIQGVRYDELAPMLLGEMQRQQKKLATQESQLGELKQEFAAMQKLNREMQVTLGQLQAKARTVAMR